MTEFAIAFRIISICFIFLLMVTLPARKKGMKKKLGQCLLPLSAGKSRYFLPIAVIAPVIILILWLRPFEIYIQIILCLSAIMGMELAVRDRITASISGVYENALIVDGRFLKKEDIAALPTLEYEEESEAFNGENADFYRKALQIVTENSGVIYVGFADEEERNQAVAILKEWL